jgi:hypothetical protein
LRPLLLVELERRVVPGFLAPLAFDTGQGPGSVAVGDFTGDGILDLAVANEISNTISILLGNGDGTFQAAREFNVGTSPRSVAVGDFNGDGVLDLAVADDVPDGNVSVLLGNGDGTFQAPRSFPAGIHPSPWRLGISMAMGTLISPWQMPATM